MLDLDISVFVVSALIGLLAMVLNRIYFRPIGNILEERETKIKTEASQIATTTVEIEAKTQHIEKVLKDTQKESRLIREALIKKGEDVKEQVITQAREKSRQHFQSQMTQLDQQLATAEKELEKEILVFSDQIKAIFIP